MTIKQNMPEQVSAVASSTKKAPRPVRVLAIDPGTRYMGMAAFADADLIRADVETLRDGPMTSQEILRKSEKIVTSWIDRYGSQLLAVEQPFFVQARSSSLLIVLTEEIKGIAVKRGLRVVEYPPTTVRRFLCGDGKATKREAARIIVTQHYPWLRQFYEKDGRRPWFRQTYWGHMFDAIGLGLTAHHRETRTTTRPPVSPTGHPRRRRRP